MAGFSYEVVARWESRGGKYFVELTRDHMGYAYQTDNGGGTFGDDETMEEIMARMERECSYAPSQMKRVI